MDPMVLKLAELEPGKKHIVRVPVTTTLGGTELSLWIHIVRGVHPGPTLALFSAIHGDEWFGIEFLRRIITELDPNTLYGTLIAVPVGNPPALEANERTVMDESGGTDLNRVFPGGGPLTTLRLAALITREVLAQADAILDFHMGDWGITWASVAYPVDLPNLEICQKSRQLAMAFGFPCIHESHLITGKVGAGSAIGYSTSVLGIPGAVVSIGGPGFGLSPENEWIEDSVKGIYNVLYYLQMLPGKNTPAPKYLVFQESWDIRPTVGGILHVNVGVDKLLSEVETGDLLGQVVSPYTFEVLEELRAPKPGVLFSLARNYPVQPGNFGFAAADLTTASTTWVVPEAAEHDA